MMSDVPEPRETEMPPRRTIAGILLVAGLLAAGMACATVFSLLGLLEKRDLGSVLTAVQGVALTVVAVIGFREVRFILRTGKASPQGIMPSPSLICFWIFIGAGAIEMTRKAIATPSFEYISLMVCMWLAIAAGIYFIRHYTKKPGRKAA